MKLGFKHLGSPKFREVKFYLSTVTLSSMCFMRAVTNLAYTLGCLECRCKGAPNGSRAPHGPTGEHAQCSHGPFQTQHP